MLPDILSALEKHCKAQMHMSTNHTICPLQRRYLVMKILYMQTQLAYIAFAGNTHTAYVAFTVSIHCSVQHPLLHGQHSDVIPSQLFCVFVGTK